MRDEFKAAEVLKSLSISQPPLGKKIHHLGHLGSSGCINISTYVNDYVYRVIHLTCDTKISQEIYILRKTYSFLKGIRLSSLFNMGTIVFIENYYFKYSLNLNQ